MHIISYSIYTHVILAQCNRKLSARQFSLNQRREILGSLQAGSHISALTANCHWQEQHIPEQAPLCQP